MPCTSNGPVSRSLLYRRQTVSYIVVTRKESQKRKRKATSAPSIAKPSGKLATCLRAVSEVPDRILSGRRVARALRIQRLEGSRRHLRRMRSGYGD
jgi:hypothetical protein